MMSRDSAPSHQHKTYGSSRAVRLPNLDYADNLDIHMVVCARSEKPFGNDALASEVCKSIEVTSAKLRYRLYGYCLMPDHLHVLLSPSNSRRPLRDWLQTFKSYTAHWAKKNLGMSGLWQRSCHDHVCRTGETAEEVLNYILNNPLRAGLADRAQAGPWSRSFFSPVAAGDSPAEETSGRRGHRPLQGGG